MLILFVALLACACEDNSYRGYEFAPEQFRLSQSVRVAVGDPMVVSKGSGPVDDLADFAGKEIHVWAFNRDSVDYRIGRQEDSLMCLVDGYPAVLNGTSSNAKWKNGGRFFYPGHEYSQKRFDFFAAYFDLKGADLEPGHIHRDSAWVSYTMQIDGSMDVMTSKASIPIAIGGDYKEYAFSYLSAQDGDLPIFTMNHGLVRIDLVVRPGITPGRHSKVQVQGAQIKSYTEATVTVATAENAEGTNKPLGVEFDPQKAKAFLDLREDDGSALKTYTMEVIDGDPNDDEPGGALYRQKMETKALGAGFFVAPDKQYDLKVTLYEPDHDTGEYTQRPPVENVVSLMNGGSFLPGNRYVVTMTIFGDRDIYTNITLVPWNASGAFILDPDQESEKLEPNPGQ